MGKVSREADSKITSYQIAFLSMKLMSNLKRKNKSFLFSHAVSYPVSGEPFEPPVSLNSHPSFQVLHLSSVFLLGRTPNYSAWNFQVFSFSASNFVPSSSFLSPATYWILAAVRAVASLSRACVTALFS